MNEENEAIKYFKECMDAMLDIFPKLKLKDVNLVRKLLIKYNIYCILVKSVFNAYKLLFYIFK